MKYLGYSEDNFPESYRNILKTKTSFPGLLKFNAAALF